MRRNTTDEVSMMEFENLTDSDIDIEPLKEIASYITDRDIELILCGDDEIRTLNSEHRGIESATDVLSFPLDSYPKHTPLGSIVISMDRVKSVSIDLGHAETDELALLFIHGLLHLTGHDHESDNGEMREQEKVIIEKFGLPSSLIIRTEGEQC